MTPLLWMWWKGYVTVRLRGPGLERLLNDAVNAGVLLLGVRRLTSDVVIVRLTVREFYHFRPLLTGSNVSVSILDRHGVPFLIRRFRLRLFLLVGLLLAVFIVLYLSNFVWFIEVSGNELLAVSTLKIAVEDQGLRTGVAKSTVNPRQIESELLKRFADLTWVQVNIKGVKVDIQVAERAVVEAAYSEAGHLYAKRDGVVTELLVLQGTPAVREGETVLKDDLLISGIYYDQWGRKQFGAAQGVVKARVWYQAIGEAPLVRWEPIKTGRSSRQYVLTIGPLRIPFGRSHSQETHLQSSQEWRLSLGKAMVPIGLTRTEYEEVEYVPMHLSATEAERQAYNLAWESLLQQGVVDKNVLEEKTVVDYLVDADGIRVTVQVEVLEDIGQFFGQ